MKRASEMTGAEVDRWLASRVLRLGVGVFGSGYVASLSEWSAQLATCRATGNSFSEALGHVMALWERENEEAPKSGPRGVA